MSGRRASRPAAPGDALESGHYSYTHYADPATAHHFDSRRFGGPIGQLVAAAQAAVLLEAVGNIRECPVLDVGTGTGRAALLLAGAGARVTGVDASAEMLAVARQSAAQADAAIVFREMDAHALQFPDLAFRVGVSLRVLMHTPRWETCLSELCRVTSGVIVVDYPCARSVARVQAFVRRWLDRCGYRTEPYRVFRDRQIAEALAKSGFRIRSIHRQFVLPIALHKAVGLPGFTNAVEGALARVGLLAIFGSPVTVVAERCESS